MLTPATNWMMCTVAPPVTTPVTAVMFAEPSATAVIRPVMLSTRATSVSLDRHRSVMPSMGFPAASRGVPANWRVRPSVTMVSAPGRTVMEATVGPGAGPVGPSAEQLPSAAIVARAATAMAAGRRGAEGREWRVTRAPGSGLNHSG
jgi:hypothetical protein